MRVIVDTSVLIALDRIGHIDLLRRLFGSVVRPQAVLEELLAGGDTHPLSDAVTVAEWIQTEPNPKSASLRPELGRGETAAISLAYESEADLIILDDLQASLADGFNRSMRRRFTSWIEGQATSKLHQRHQQPQTAATPGNDF